MAVYYGSVVGSNRAGDEAGGCGSVAGVGDYYVVADQVREAVQ